MTIRIGILGYGNLGRGVEAAIRQNEDLSLVAVFTEIPWLDVMYSPPTKSSLNAKKDASQIGIVFLSCGVNVFIP